jgi:hypothetical protein
MGRYCGTGRDMEAICLAQIALWSGGPRRSAEADVVIDFRRPSGWSRVAIGAR